MQGQWVRDGAGSRHPGKYEPSTSTLGLERWRWVGETPRLQPSKGVPLLELRATFAIPSGPSKKTKTPSSPSHRVPHPHRCPKKLVVGSVVEGGCEFVGVRVHSRSLAIRVANGWVGHDFGPSTPYAMRIARSTTKCSIQGEWRRLQAALTNEQVGYVQFLTPNLT